MTRHPLQKGRLIYDMENEEILEVNRIARNYDQGNFIYQLCDGSHTEYEEFNETEIGQRFLLLPITVHDNFKSEYLLDYENLLENLEGNFGYESLCTKN